MAYPKPIPPDAHVCELPADAVIVRGGLMIVEDLQDAAEVAMARWGAYAISVYGGDGSPVIDLCRSGNIRNGRVRTSTAGEIAGREFSITKTLGPGHYSIWLPSTAVDVLHTLVTAFGEPIPNPLLSIEQPPQLR